MGIMDKFESGKSWLGEKKKKYLDPLDMGTPLVKKYTGDGDAADQEKKDRLNAVGASGQQFGDSAAGNYAGLTGRLNGSLDALQAQANGQNSVSAMQLQQGLQQNQAAQRSFAAGASPNNSAAAARTAAMQMGRMGTGLAGQQALAGLQERNQAQQNYASMLGAARGQDMQGALGGYNTATTAYGGGLNGQPTKSSAEKYAPIVAGLAAMSDERAKTAIAPGSGAAGHALGKLNPYTFSYRDQGNGSGRQLGVMAQDLERAGLKQAVIDTPAGKMVDGAKLATANTAMLASISDRLDAVEKDKPRLNGRRK